MGNNILEKLVLNVKPGMFRLFLAMLVVLGHALRPFIPFGPIAVYTFFILSGYWVAKMYNEFYQKKDNAYWIFLFSRVLRLFPLYWLCTLILIAIQKFFLPRYGIEPMPDIGFFQAICIMLLVPLNFIDLPLLGPAWSLAVEMQFYIIAPFIIILIKKVNFYVLGAIIVLLTIYFSLVINIKTNETVLPYLLYFFIGMAIYHRKLMVSKALVMWSLFIALSVILICYSIPVVRQALLFKTLLFNSINLNVIFVSIVPFLFVPFIVNNLQQKSDIKDRHYGDFSYTIYLVHAVVFKVYYSFYQYGGFTSAKLFGFIVTICMVFLLSFFIYFFFEKKVEKFRKALIKTN